MASKELREAYETLRNGMIRQCIVGPWLVFLEAVEKEHPELVPPPTAKFHQDQIVVIQANALFGQIVTRVYSQTLHMWDYKCMNGDTVLGWFPETTLRALTTWESK